jgi:hypothetical protein
MEFAFAGEELEATTPVVGDIEGWRKVRSGITLIWIGTLISIGMAILAVCGGVALAGIAAQGALSAPGGGSDWIVAMFIFVGVAVIGNVLIHVLKLVGHVFCLWAPAKRHAKPLAIACLVLFALGFGLQMLGWIVTLAEGGGFGGVGFLETGLLNYGGQAIELIEIVVFLVFLRAIARCIRDRRLAESCRSLIMLAGAVVLLVIGMFGVLFAIEKGGSTDMAPIAVLGCMCMIGGLGLVALVMYIILLSQMRTSLASYICRLERV